MLYVESECHSLIDASNVQSLISTSANRDMYDTDDALDFGDLSVHLTVHCSLKCLGMDTSGNKKNNFF